ncbi:MAG: hypothetical protein HZB39_06410 [Planctomycetes bacterium]|nr:hypothetical protein [Planctomycetota bacterium]
MRVLVVRLSAMGDVVHGLAAMTALRAARPDDELHQVVQAPFAPLLEGLDLTSVIAHDRKGGPRAFLRTARRLRALRCDVALDLQGNWKSAALAWASRAPRRIGSVRAQRREPSSSRLLNEFVTAPSSHPDDVAWALARVLAEELVPAHPPVLRASDEECVCEASALRALGVDPLAPFRVLVLADLRDPRALDAASLQREATAARMPVLALAGPDEPDAAAPPGVAVLRHERGELRRLIALGTLGARAGASAFAPDKGASHVLAACGLRTTIVHRTTDPARTGSRHATLSASPIN